MVLFKHPFHLCWIPALTRDGRVERRASESADNVQKSRQKRSKQNVNNPAEPGAFSCPSIREVTSLSDTGEVLMVLVLPSSALSPATNARVSTIRSGGHLRPGKECNQAHWGVLENVKDDKYWTFNCIFIPFTAFPTS